MEKQTLEEYAADVYEMSYDNLVALKSLTEFPSVRMNDTKNMTINQSKKIAKLLKKKGFKVYRKKNLLTLQRIESVTGR